MLGERNAFYTLAMITQERKWGRQATPCTALRREPVRSSFTKREKITGRVKERIIFIALKMSVLTSTVEKDGEENSVVKCSSPTKGLYPTKRNPSFLSLAAFAPCQAPGGQGRPRGCRPCRKSIYPRRPRFPHRAARPLAAVARRSLPQKTASTRSCHGVARAARLPDGSVDLFEEPGADGTSAVRDDAGMP